MRAPLLAFEHTPPSHIQLSPLRSPTRRVPLPATGHVVVVVYYYDSSSAVPLEAKLLKASPVDTGKVCVSACPQKIPNLRCGFRK